jgi:hypothetical protein
MECPFPRFDLEGNLFSAILFVMRMDLTIWDRSINKCPVLWPESSDFGASTANTELLRVQLRQLFLDRSAR